MNVLFQSGNDNHKSKNVEWYTPPTIIRSLGEFDLDPCTSISAIELNQSAKHFFIKEDNGLAQIWTGRIWMNPPYQNPDIALFMKKLSEHNNGIALVYNRCDSKWFQDYVLEKADSILFLRKRIKFLKPDGSSGDSPGAGSVLIAYGENNTESLRNCNLEGKLIKINLLKSCGN